MLLLWTLLVAAAAAYELHYVNRTVTFTPKDLPPVGGGGHYEYTADKRVRTDSVVHGGTSGFVVRLFLSSFCFTGESFDPTGPTAEVGDLYHLDEDPRQLSMTKTSTSYWCLNTTLNPSSYMIDVSGVQWWESMTITFPVPAPENAVSDDVLIDQILLVEEDGNDSEHPKIADDTFLTVPGGSVMKTGFTQRTPWISMNSSLTFMPPQGAAFLIVYASTAPGNNIHWEADCRYAFSNPPPWFPDDKTDMPLLTKAAPLLDNNYAAVFMTPLNPSVRTNVTFSSNFTTAHNLTMAQVYTVHVDPSRNESTTTAILSGPSTLSGAQETTTAVLAPASKSKSVSTGAIAGGVVGGVAGLVAIIGTIIFLLRRRRRQDQEQKTDDSRASGMFEIEGSQPSLVPTPFALPSSAGNAATSPARGAVGPEIPPVFLKGDPTQDTNPRPFSKSHSRNNSTATPSGSTAPESPLSNMAPQLPPLRGPRVRNDVDAGALRRADEDDAASDTGTLLVPPTYDPRWRSSGASETQEE